MSKWTWEVQKNTWADKITFEVNGVYRMLSLHEREQDLGFTEKMREDLFLPQPNIGVLALNRVLEVDIISPFDTLFSKKVREAILDTKYHLEDKCQSTFDILRTVIGTGDDDNPAVLQSVIMTSTSEQGVDARKFDLQQTNLMSVLQYAALFKTGLPVDTKPPHRELEKPQNKVKDHQDVWTSSLLRNPLREGAFYAGVTRNNDPVVTALSHDRATHERTPVESHKHITYLHPYRVRPTIEIKQF